MVYTRENAPSVTPQGVPETRAHLNRLLALDRAADLRWALPVGWSVVTEGNNVIAVNPLGRRWVNGKVQ
jgi:hypothetical protein